MSTKDFFQADQPHYAELLAWCLNNKSEALALLPFEAAEIADECGFQALFYLVTQVGGQPIHVPKSATPRFAMAAGAASGALIEKWAAETIVVSTCDSLKRRFELQQIERLKREGFSNSIIAGHLGVHIRTIERAVKKLGLSGQRAPASQKSRAEQARRISQPALKTVAGGKA